MKYRYDVGDAVVVRQDLKMGCAYFMESGPKKYAYNDIVDEMEEFKGKIVHIAAHDDGQYRIVEDDEVFGWTDGMFQTQGKYDAVCVCESLL